MVVWLRSIGCALTLGGLGNKAAWPAGVPIPLASEEGDKEQCFQKTSYSV